MHMKRFGDALLDPNEVVAVTIYDVPVPTESNGFSQELPTVKHGLVFLRDGIEVPISIYSAERLMAELAQER